MRNVLIFLLLAVLVVPAGALEAASYKGEVAGWVPWFAWESGMESAEEHLDELDTVYLFVYEIGEDGAIIEKVDTDTRQWRSFIRKLEKARVDIIPTIAWFDGNAIHETLSDRKKRQSHVAMIAEFVDDNDFDGVDIDYEQKLAETIDHFSAFLEELEDELGRDDLVCTIEARMPPKSRWRVVPEYIEYANDYREINKHCDRIQVMAYDQQRADLLLNDARLGLPYVPVADKEWVEKVLEFALKDFDHEKVMLGVPTYGRAWDITVAPEWYRDYTRVASLNQPRIMELSEKYDSPIGRTAGGEAVISYFPEDSIFKALNALPTPPNTPKGYEAAAKALLFATAAKMEVPVRIVVWSDAAAVEDKIDLAKKYDLEGISIFKIDGEEDQDIWDLF